MSLTKYGLDGVKESKVTKKTTKKSSKKTEKKKEFKPLIEIKKEEKVPEVIEIKEPVIQLTPEEINEILNKKETIIEEDSENVNGNHLIHSKIKSIEIRIKKFIHHETKELPISARIIKSYLYLSNNQFDENIIKVLENYPNIKKVQYKGEESYIWGD